MIVGISPGEADSPVQDALRLIAFYLPQFHPIPENSEWWGPGFTEWHNVAAARPQFAGHRQPRLPQDLGFYDLRLKETREAQAALAGEYGIHGFCYHTYWLANGKRLLEAPLAAILREQAPDFPFCICWANESWTRRWDGGNAEILAEQSHDEANNIAFFEAMLPAFRDPRYICVDGRPLLLIYRASLFPDIQATLANWRLIAERNGMKPPYVVAVEFFDINASQMIARGFDAICEFPPVRPGTQVADMTVPATNAGPGFKGQLIDYERLSQWFIDRPDDPYPRHRAVTLEWDNTARRDAEATVTVNFSLQRYQEWLRAAIERTRAEAPPGKQLVFINAWNEWAEGTYLEPDRQYGRGCLEATRAALLGASQGEPDAVSQPSATAPAPAKPADNGVPPIAPGSMQDKVSAIKIVGIACVGNEADMVEAFVRHNLAYFDRLLILEHNTIDGTRVILDRLVAEGLPLTVENSTEVQFRQVAFTNRLLRMAIEEHDADWVFPIDCDEFVIANGRAHLDAALAAAGRAHVRLRWINYVPAPADDATEQHPLRRIRHYYDYPAPSAMENPWVWKVGVNVALLGDYFLDRYEICRGNHFLSLPGQHSPVHAPMTPQQDLALAHFPMRSPDQMAIKSALGLLGRLGIGARSAYYGDVWRQITSSAIDLDSLATATRNFLDTGRKLPDALAGTPMRYGPLPVEHPLVYSNLRIPAIGVLLKWVELNLLDEKARADTIWGAS